MSSCPSSRSGVELIWLWSFVGLCGAVALAAVVSVPENITYRVGGLAITGARLRAGVEAAFCRSSNPGRVIGVERARLHILSGTLTFSVGQPIRTRFVQCSLE